MVLYLNKQLNMTLLYVSTVALFGSACGSFQPDSSPKAQELHQLIQAGRSVAYGIFTPTYSNESALYLADHNELLALASDQNNSALSWEMYDIDKMPRINSDNLEMSAREFINTHGVSFMVDDEELSSLENFITPINSKMISLTFARSYHELPVRDAYIELIYTRMDDQTYALRESINRSFGHIVPKNPDSTPASLADVEALTGISNFSLIAVRRIILPRNEEANTYSFYIATEFKIKDHANDNTLIVTLGDGARNVLEAYATRIFDTKSSLSASVYTRNYMTSSYNDPMTTTTFTLGSNKQATDLDGFFTAGPTGSANVTLSSGRVAVYDSSKGSSTPVQLAFSIASTTPPVVKAGTSDMPALNAYMAINRINRFARHQLSPSIAPFLNTNLKTNVNVSGNCNAYYDPDNDTLNFYAEGNNCANTALVDDVIYHEWGHNMDAHLGKTSGITDDGFSEGIADVNSAYYLGDANLGGGFNLNDPTALRSAKNTNTYPKDKGEAHVTGLIISGAFWDLRDALIARYGDVRGAYYAQYLFYNHLRTSDTLLDSYQAVLRLDDDDGNASTNSPNHCLINAAFAKHGLTTAENCQDPAVTSIMPMLADITVAVNKSDTSGVLLMASTTNTEVASGVLCLADRNKCTNLTDSSLVQFSLEGTQNQKIILLAKSSISLTDQQLFTIILKDSNGQTLGGRTVKWISK